MLENSLYKWLEGMKDIFLAILSSIVPKLPIFIQTPLEMFGIVSYLERSMDKYKYQEEKIQQKKEELEK